MLIYNITAVIHYVGQEFEPESYVAEFSPSSSSWQPAEISFEKQRFAEVEKITVECNYSYNAGNAYFDDLRLFRTDIETGLCAEDFESDDELETASEEATDEAETPEFEEAVDVYGNTITSTTFGEDFGTIYGSYDYIGEKTEMVGNDLVCETDARGNKTYYTTNPETSRNSCVTDRCGNKTYFEYDCDGRTTKVTTENKDGIKTAEVGYRYDDFGNMTRIARGDDQRYLLAYNGYHKLESIGVAGKALPLVAYKYKNGSGRIKEITYATGFSTRITYNDKGQIMCEKLSECKSINCSSINCPISECPNIEAESAECPKITKIYRYGYDNAGNMVRALDTANGLEYNYTYDSGVLVRSSVVKIGVVPKVPLCSVEYVYDNSGSLEKRIVFDGENTVTYNTNDDSLTINYKGKEIKLRSKTDELGRKCYEELCTGKGFVSREFSYHAGKETDEHAQNTRGRFSCVDELNS